MPAVRTVCHPRAVTATRVAPEPTADPLSETAASAAVPRTPAPDDRLERRLHRLRLIIASCLALAALVALRLLLTDGAQLIGLLLALLLALLGLALLVARRTAATIAGRRTSRGASMTRILQGLSRSLSPESVVDAIVQELTNASDADHVVVARVRQPDQVVEVTLSAARASVPPSRTYLRPDVPPLSTDAGLGGTASGMQEGTARNAPVAAHDASVTPRTARADAGSPGLAASGARTVTLDAPGRRARLASQAAADEVARRVRSAYGLPHTLAAPLLADGRFLGALVLSKRTRDSWSDGDRRLLSWAATEVAAAFARAYALEEAERDASTDALTGLPNRRAFDDLLASVPQRRRAQDEVGILMVDIDRFKGLNDRHGHATGDAVLRAVAAAIAATVRAEDTPARYGGEEFAVILRRASPPQAVEVAERVRRAVADIPPGRLGVDLPVTVSVGVAVAGPDEPIGSVIERADEALYLAKRRGRDRVVAG